MRLNYEIKYNVIRLLLLVMEYYKSWINNYRLLNNLNG